MKKIFKIGFWIIVIGVLIWVGIGVIDSCQGDTSAKPPDVEKAHYRILVKANHNILYTNDYHKDGTTHYLDGYWEQINDKYKYRKGILPLDENTFGEIKVTIRR